MIPISLTYRNGQGGSIKTIGKAQKEKSADKQVDGRQYTIPCTNAREY